MYFRTLMLALVASLLMLASGCATLMNDSPQTIKITSDPSGAKVVIDGVDHGVTPVTTELPTSLDHSVTVEAAGYPAETVQLSSSVSVGYVILDIFFAVVPLIVDFYTQDIYNLEPEDDLHFQFADLPEPTPVEPQGGGFDMNWNNGGGRDNGAPANNGGQSEEYCCVNGAYYSCPNAMAVAQCAPPQLASCLISCGMTDFQCPESCLSQYPPDPSACSRQAGRDGDCR